MCLCKDCLQLTQSQPWSVKCIFTLGLFLLLFKPQIFSTSRRRHSQTSSVWFVTVYSIPSQFLHLATFSFSVFCTNKKNTKKKLSHYRTTDTERPSGSVSHVVAEEDDVVWGHTWERLCFKKSCWIRLCVCVSFLTCNDGGGLTSDLVLVHILSIVQFPFH